MRALAEKLQQVRPKMELFCLLCVASGGEVQITSAYIHACMDVCMYVRMYVYITHTYTYAYDIDSSLASVINQPMHEDDLCIQIWCLSIDFIVAGASRLSLAITTTPEAAEAAAPASAPATTTTASSTMCSNSKPKAPQQHFRYPYIVTLQGSSEP